MRFTSTASALVLGAAAVLAKELPKDELKAGTLDPIEDHVCVGLGTNGIA